MKVGAFIPDFGSVILSLVFKRIFGRGNHLKVVCTSFMIIVNQSKPRIHFLEKHSMIGICTLLLKDSLCWYMCTNISFVFLTSFLVWKKHGNASIQKSRLLPFHKSVVWFLQVALLCVCVVGSQLFFPKS